MAFCVIDCAWLRLNNHFNWERRKKCVFQVWLGLCGWRFGAHVIKKSFFLFFIFLPSDIVALQQDIPSRFLPAQRFASPSAEAVFLPQLPSPSPPPSPARLSPVYLFSLFFFCSFWLVELVVQAAPAVWHSLSNSFRRGLLACAARASGCLLYGCLGGGGLGAKDAPSLPHTQGNKRTLRTGPREMRFWSSGQTSGTFKHH